MQTATLSDETVPLSATKSTGISHWMFYAQNYFRIFVSDQVVEFVREAELPSELALGERSLVKGLLNTGQFTIVRWISTSQGWDDNDRPYTVSIAEGNKESTVPLLR